MAQVAREGFAADDAAAVRMKVCLSQFRSGADTALNLRRHVDVVRRAAQERCDLVLFPELSVTGYRLTDAAQHVMDPHASAFDPLADLAMQHGSTIAVGVPLAAGGGAQIGMVVFDPSGRRSTYAKQHLHADEQPFFLSGEVPLDLRVGEARVAPAICYESLVPEHAAAAMARGATVYAASVAKPTKAIARAHAHYAGLASRYGVAVLVVNAVGRCEGFASAGRSAAWSREGALIEALDEEEGELFLDL